MGALYPVLVEICGELCGLEAIGDKEVACTIFVLESIILDNALLDASPGGVLEGRLRGCQSATWATARRETHR